MKHLSYEQREEIGREALLELQHLYPQKLKYSINFTTGCYDVYDAYFMVIDEETQSIKKRVWIEIKIRDTVYPDYILEENKYNNMKKEMNKIGFNFDDVDLYYLNFTPNGTYLWKINNIDDKYESESKMMNKNTTRSRYNKTNKNVYMIETKDAISFNYIIDIDRIFDKIRYTYKENIKNKRKGLDAFFDQIK